MMRSQMEGCDVIVSEASPLGAGRLCDQSGPTQFPAPQSSFVIRCLSHVTRLAHQSLSGIVLPPRAAKRGLCLHFIGSRAFAKRLNPSFISPQSVIPTFFSGLIMKCTQHSFSLGVRSPSCFIAGSRFGGSFSQSQFPSGLTPRSSGPGCAGPLNFFR